MVRCVVSLPLMICSATACLRPSSAKGGSPLPTASTLDAEVSTPMTLRPALLRAAAVGRPMYPRPTTATVLIGAPSDGSAGARVRVVVTVSLHLKAQGAGDAAKFR